MTGTWAVKRKPVGNPPYPALRSGWTREARAGHGLWMCLAAVGCVLGTVTMSSVLTGPSAGATLVAIRVTQQELSLAKRIIRDPLLNEAESLLIRAWSTLKERRYGESIVAAREAYQKIMDSSR
jgi:hypothetical protein